VKYTLLKSNINQRDGVIVNTDNDIFYNITLYQKDNKLYVREYNFTNKENFPAENNPVGSEVGYRTILGIDISNITFNIDEIHIKGYDFNYNLLLLKLVDAESLTEKEKLQIGI
jgi:hypothetical protein